MQQSNPDTDSAASAPNSPLNLAALTQGMVDGDEEAYRTFYDAYFKRLFRYLLVVAQGDEQTARDVLQATSIRIVRHIKVFNDETHFWSWLTKLARSTLFDEKRKGRRYFSFLDRFTQQTQTEQFLSGDNHTEERLETLLDEGIAELAPEDQQLVRHKYMEGLSVRKIAQGLQATEKSIESRLSRIRQKLRADMVSRLKDEQ